MHANKVWNKSKIIDAIKDWAVQHNHPPTSTNWLHTSYEQEDKHPSYSTVVNYFGSWADALEAAGYQGYHKRLTPLELIAEKSNDEIAKIEIEIESCDSMMKRLKSERTVLKRAAKSFDNELEKHATTV